MDDKEKVIKIISVVTKVDIKQINETSSMNDLVKWDSLAHLNIMEQIEKSFKKRISTSKMSDLNSIDKILKFLNK
jgi:acyl carrier protein|tara:strand:+ start:243 stop:467 length:225 start_codon:yes stop_codon:yes gene_type:complete